jgi:hypothetical protein
VFSEFRDQITQLKASDPHFRQLFDKHDALDVKIRNMETHVELGTHEEIETLKKEKLLLKDQVYAILRKTGIARA